MARQSSACFAVVTGLTLLPPRLRLDSELGSACVEYARPQLKSRLRKGVRRAQGLVVVRVIRSTNLDCDSLIILCVKCEVLRVLKDRREKHMAPCNKTHTWRPGRRGQHACHVLRVESAHQRLSSAPLAQEQESGPRVEATFGHDMQDVGKLMICRDMSVFAPCL